jgi:hypothetical protein
VEGAGNMTKKYFYFEESPYQPGKYKVNMNFDEFPGIHTIGSYNLLPARLLGLCYAEYLRYCRDIYGAEIIGKNNMYPVAYFKDSFVAGDLVKILNERMAQIEKERSGKYVSDK